MKNMRFTFMAVVFIHFFFNLSQSSVNAQSSSLLYGVANGGNNTGLGVLFHIDPVTHVQTIDHKFTGSPSPTGYLSAFNGKYYGVTEYIIGCNGYCIYRGKIFEWDPVSSTFSNKVDFDNTSAGYSYGNSLTLCGDKFYGMTFGNDFVQGVMGALYEWDPVTNVFTIKHVFDGNTGAYPQGNNLTVYNGKLYGMTVWGGNGNCGVIFEYDPKTDIFTKKQDLYYYNNFYWPWGNSLTLYNGMFYSVDGYGDIIEWNPQTNVLIVKIHHLAPLSNGSMTVYNGKLYYQGWRSYLTDTGEGIYAYNPMTNEVTVEYLLDGTTGSWGFGNNSLTLSNGKFFGMTYWGGTYSKGTIFEWDPLINSFTILTEFDGTNGQNPYFTKFTAFDNTDPCKDGKVLICHRTGSHNHPCEEICVDENAVPAHLAHGDNLGHCSSDCSTKSSLIGDEENSGLTRIYPNPVDDILNISFHAKDGEKVLIQVINTHGRVLYSTEKRGMDGENLYQLNMKPFTDGIYIIKISNGESLNTSRLAVVHNH